MDNFYDKIKKNSKASYDKPLITIIILLLLVSTGLFISVIYMLGCNRRFLDFISNLSYSTTYAYENECLIANIDDRFYKISDKNMYGIFAYLSLSKSGRESKKVPEGEPVELDYGDGAMLRLWDMPSENGRHNLFLQYTDIKGDIYSYISYKTTLETVVVRYLTYGNEEIDKNS